MRCLLHCLLLALLLAPAHAQFDDDLDGFTLEEREPLSEAQALERLQVALSTADPQAREARLLELFDALQQNPRTILPPRDWQLFLASLTEDAAGEALRQRLPPLLQDAAQADVEPAATRKLNLGLQLAATAGGTDAETLKAILRHRPDADLQWLLPALGRVGGPPVLPVIQRYRQDDRITPLNHPQNLQPEACAAVLGAAYAGDPEAAEQILRWYEADTRDLPRFAGYVQWAIREGEPVDYRMLDYCRQRLRQAEHWLDVQDDERLPELIRRANDQLAIALTGYLLRRQTEVADQRPFLPLLKNPELVVKAAAVRTFLEANDAALRSEVLAMLTRQLTSEQAAERFAAAVLLLRHNPQPPLDTLQQLADHDPSPELRLRLRQRLKNHHE